MRDDGLYRRRVRWPTTGPSRVQSSMCVGQDPTERGDPAGADEAMPPSPARRPAQNLDGHDGEKPATFSFSCSLYSLSFSFPPPTRSLLPLVLRLDGRRRPPCRAISRGPTRSTRDTRWCAARGLAVGRTGSLTPDCAEEGPAAAHRLCDVGHRLWRHRATSIPSSACPLLISAQGHESALCDQRHLPADRTGPERGGHPRRHQHVCRPSVSEVELVLTATAQHHLDAAPRPARQVLPDRARVWVGPWSLPTVEGRLSSIRPQHRRWRRRPVCALQPALPARKARVRAHPADHPYRQLAK